MQRLISRIMLLSVSHSSSFVLQLAAISCYISHFISDEQIVTRSKYHKSHDKEAY